MIGRIAKGALLGVVFVLAAGVWPAAADLSSVKVTNPTSGSVVAGSYSSSGTPSGFTVTIKGQATTSCRKGFSSVKFTVSGPSSYSKTFSPTRPTTNGTYTFTAAWDTSSLKNGLYDVRLDVAEPGTSNLGLDNCTQSSTSAHLSSDAKLANPPVAPVWNGSPTAASDGSANVTLSWNQNPEPDVVEYAAFRQGPDGTKKIGVVNASSPGSSGCSLSGGSYTCVDPASDFPNPYDGTYSYVIVALRSRPSFNSGEDTKYCETPSSQTPCVASQSSDARQVTLTSPTPTPSPTDSPTPGGSPTPGPGGNGGGGGTTTTTGGSSSSTGGKKPSSVLSFGSSRGPSQYNEFYTGTYSEQLPYSPKTFIVGGGGKKTVGAGQQVASGSLNPGPPNYRTIMLPVAGGLLAFLSAAHVRRLLIHF